LVPVHSQLLALGFEKYVAGLRQRKQAHLFPVWYREGMAAKAKAPRETATIDHYFPRFLPRRFNVTYLPKVGIVDSRKTWHSFRHTFKSGLKMAGVPKDNRLMASCVATPVSRCIPLGKSTRMSIYDPL
jgi:hypothetical protein